MPPLRELATRFTFETDRRGIEDFSKSIGSMRNQVLQLGSLLGVALGGRALFDAGLDAERAAAGLRAATTAAEGGAGGFARFDRVLDSTREQISGVVGDTVQLASRGEFRQLATRFVETFGAGAESAEQFGELFSAASSIAVARSRETSEVFGELFGIVRGGNFEQLRQFGIDPAVVDRLNLAGEAINQIQVETPRLQTRLGALVDTLGDADLEAPLAGVTREQLAVQDAANSLQSTIERIGQRIQSVLTPAIEVLEDLADKFLDVTESAQSFGDALPSVVRTALEAAGVDLPELSEEEKKRREAERQKARGQIAEFQIRSAVDRAGGLPDDQQFGRDLGELQRVEGLDAPRVVGRGENLRVELPVNIEIQAIDTEALAESIREAAGAEIDRQARESQALDGPQEQP